MRLRLRRSENAIRRYDVMILFQTLTEIEQHRVAAFDIFARGSMFGYMSLKDAYHQKMEAQLEEQQARLNLLRAKAKRAVAEGRILVYEELGEAEEKLSHAKAHLKKVAHSSEAAFKEMKTGMEVAWQDLKSACQNAAKHYKDPASPAADSSATASPSGDPTTAAAPPPSSY
jgi:hypothetical protein